MTISIFISLKNQTGQKSIYEYHNNYIYKILGEILWELIKILDNVPVFFHVLY